MVYNAAVMNHDGARSKFPGTTMEVHMRSKFVLLAVLGIGATVALLPGCKSPPTKAEMDAADYGPQPENHEQLVRDYLKPKLKDAESAIIEFRAGPKRLYQQDTLLRPLQYGWGVCVLLNEKNDAGTYTGFQPIVFYIHSGKVIAMNGGPDDSIIGNNYARDGCKELGAVF
jgi:hypothetical protein